MLLSKLQKLSVGLSSVFVQFYARTVTLL